MNTVMRTLAVGTVLLVTAFFTAGASAQNTDDMLTQLMTVLNTNMPPNLNADAIANVYAEDAVEVFLIGAAPDMKNPMNGREEIKEFYSGFDEVFSDLTHIEVRRTVQERHAVWEGTVKGTHKDTGKPVKFPLLLSIRFNDGGSIVTMDVYLNSSLMAEQLK
jgi:ketosteroid isomerase-like protein